jgi:hypothetical protein
MHSFVATALSLAALSLGAVACGAGADSTPANPPADALASDGAESVPSSDQGKTVTVEPGQGGAAPVVCNLACVQGAHCETSSGKATCVADRAVVCNLACVKGTHCDTSSGAPTCVP